MTGRNPPLTPCVMTTIVVDTDVCVEVNSIVVPGAVVVLTMVSSEVSTTVTEVGVALVSVTVTVASDPLTVAVPV